MLFRSKVKDGNARIVRRKDFDELIKSFEGKELTITIEKKKNNRSILQNNYYWGVVIPMLREGMKEHGMNVTKEECHELMKHKFCIKEIVNEKTGEIMKYAGSTTELTTIDFMELVQNIQQFAAEFLAVNIPSPGEEMIIDFGK